MWRYLVILVTVVGVTTVESACPQPQQYYVECGSPRSLNSSNQLCTNHGMTLLNLTNSSHIIADISLLNQTLEENNCSSQFWFSSSNKTGYVASVNTLDDVLTGILTGLLGTLGGVLNIVGSLIPCLFGGCPSTTTPAPVTNAITICIRPVQQRVIQKCLAASVRTDMQTFQYTEQPMYGGILDSFPSRSRSVCSSLCSINDECVGISYINETCNLYM